MNGQFCLVTGSTHGIGYETARALAAAGASVLVHGRDLTRARAAALAIGRDTGSAAVNAVQADFRASGTSAASHRNSPRACRAWTCSSTTPA